MMGRRFFARLLQALTLAALAATTPLALAQDLVTTAATTFLTPAAKARRVGLEVEIAGLGLKESAKIVQDRLGGKLSVTAENELLLAGSQLGDLRIYRESQGWRKSDWFDADSGAPHWSDPLFGLLERFFGVVEIVSPPLRYDEVPAFATAITDLKKSGAKGTNVLRAISTQVNVEIFPPGTDPKSPENVALLTALLQNYYHVAHGDQLTAALHPPRIRREYLLPLDPSFARRLSLAGYQPTAEELFFDYFYLQIYARNVGDPTNKSDDEIRAAVLALPDPVDKAVVKQSRLQAASALLFAFPEEPLARQIIESGWNKPRPAAEFREANTDFEVLHTVNWALGVVEASARHGEFDHDALMAGQSGLSPIAIERLRAGAGTGRLRVIRYNMASRPYAADLPLWERQWKRVMNWIRHGSAEVYELDELSGKTPLVLGGPTVLWHRRHIHRRTILARYNPALVNYNLQEALENKLFEAKLLERYVPGAMPKTSSLADIAGSALAGEGWDETRLARLKEKLDLEFPGGWVLKGAYAYNTGTPYLITDKDDLPRLAAGLTVDFGEVIQALRDRYPELDFEGVLKELKKRPDYKSYLLAEALKNPELTLAQERLELVGEYRVDMLEGEPLPGTTTIDMQIKYGPFPDKVKRVVLLLTDQDPNARIARQAAAQWIAKLPKHFRMLPFGLDVGLVRQNGKIVARLIETNPGGNSGTLQTPLNARALNRYLRDYVKRAAENKVYTGLSGREQMRLLAREFAALGLLTEKHFPGMIFRDDEIVDPAVCRKDVVESLLLEPSR